jgi:hypothetical protein
MTKQRMAQRLADGGAASEFEVDARVGAQKEENGMAGLRESLLIESMAKQLIEMPEDVFISSVDCSGGKWRAVLASSANPSKWKIGYGPNPLKAISDAITSCSEVGF